MDRIITEKTRFLDSEGRTRLFNGFNIDDKLLNCKEFRYNLDEEFFKKYRAYGLDFIRLAVTWQNLEPEMGRYNESYLKSIDSIFALAEKYGVYILLDMHQDLYSGNDGKSAGDGAPEWAVITDGAKPRMPIFVWADGYFFGRWVHKSFDHFWYNTPVDGIGIQDRYAKLWQMLAARYGDSPALFGFDLMNEPFPGTLARRLFSRLILSAARVIVLSGKVKRGKLVKAVLTGDERNILGSLNPAAVKDVVRKLDSISAEFDSKLYSPFLNKMTAAIREITPNGIIMIEQSYICNSGVKQSVPPITVNGEREPLQCFGPHAYDMTVDTPLYKYADSDRVKMFFTEMYHTQLRLDVPVIVGEWGGCSDNTDTSWFPHAYDLLDFFDEKQWGQSYWDYHGDDLDAPLMTMLCRTHPVAVSGNIISYGFNRDKNVFTLKNYCETKGESTVYVHKPFKMLSETDFTVIEEYPNGASLINIKNETGVNEVSISIV